MKKLISNATPLLISAALSLGLASAVFCAESQSPRNLPLIDIHAHFFRMTPDSVIRAMDQEDITLAVFMPVANAGRARKRRASEDFYLDAAKAFPKRMAAFYGGNELNLDFMGTAPNRISDDRKERFRKQVEEVLKQGGFKGIGELAPRHIAWNPGMQEIEYPADHPLMLVLADLAAKYELPMDIHLEANEKTIAQFERLLAHNEKTKIIWSHAGWSNTGLATPELMRRLMARFPNLYSSIKYRKPENPGQEKVKLIDEKSTLVMPWGSLFEEFSERFFIGTDVKLGDTESDYRHARTHRRILAQLSESTARKISWENAKRLLGLNDFP
jgi:predicted TIM-barrel fold metal-dependent hydrolase